MRRVLPCGPGAWLVETVDPVALEHAVRAAGRPGIVDVVPGAATLLVTTDRASDDLAGWLAGVGTDPTDPPPVVAIEIPVIYDGEDLTTVAEAVGCSTDDVVARHTAATYHCAFCGFAPGFAYLGGLDPSLHLPRRATPRTRVPAGAVAIAAEHTAVYPSPSPGGWHLIGRTDVELWDARRDPPALIVPGTTVRFVVA